MRTLIAACILGLCLATFCYAAEAVPANAQDSELRELLATGYSQSKAVLDDSRIIFQQKHQFDGDWLKDIKSESPALSYSDHEYIGKNGKQRAAVLYHGVTEAKKEAIDSRIDSIGSENSPSYDMFDGEKRLYYFPTKGSRDSTQRGRAILDRSNINLLELNKGPLKLFGYVMGGMPDDVLASGYLWEENRKQLAYKPFAVVQPSGKGYVIGFTQDPNVRAYLDGLNLIFMNAILRGSAHARPIR